MDKEQFLTTRTRTENMSESHPDFVNGDPSLENTAAYIYDDSFFIQIMEDGRFFTACGNQDIVSKNLSEVEDWLWPQADAMAGYSYDETA